MGKGLIFKNTAKVGGSSILKSLMYLRFLFYGLWIAILFTVPIIDSIENNDPTIFFKEVGGKLVLATTTLNNELAEINEQGYIIEQKDEEGLESLVNRVIEWFKAVGTIYVSIFTLWLWLRLFVWIMSKFNDTSRPFVNYTIAFIIMFLLQIVFIFAFGDKNWLVVFTVWKELYNFAVISVNNARTFLS